MLPPANGQHHEQLSSFSEFRSDVHPETSWVGLSILASTIAAIAIWGHYKIGLSIALGLLTCVMLVYNFIYIVVGRFMGIVPAEVAIYFGRPLFMFRCGDTVYRINWFPSGSWVKYHGAEDDDYDSSTRIPGKAYRELHPLLRALHALSAPSIVLLLGITFVGVEGVHEFVVALCGLSSQPVLSVQNGLAGALRPFLGNIPHAPFVTSLGSIAVVMGLLNLIPLPLMPGGIAIAQFTRWLAGVSDTSVQRVMTLIGVPTLLLMLGLFGYFCWALGMVIFMG
jgi:hypothetical protein